MAVLDVPSVEGTFPTITKPLCSIASAVERPRPVDPLGWGGPAKKTRGGPAVETRTIVVPVPCRFALLLKFETRTCPGFRGPVPLWKPGGTKATPYGFTSPLGGTVERILSWSGRKASASARGIPVKTAQSAIPMERSLVTRFFIVGIVPWFLTSADIL